MVHIKKKNLKKEQESSSNNNNICHLSRLITSWQIGGETVADFILGGSKSLQMVITAIKLKDTYSLEGKLLPT